MTGRPAIDGQGPCPGACNAAWRHAWREWQVQHDAAAVRALAALHLVAAYAQACVRPLLDTVAAMTVIPPPTPVDPTLGDPTWCARCVASIRRAFANLDDLAALLAAGSDGHRRRPAQGRTGAVAGTASPSPQADLADELLGALVALEDYWRAVRGYPTRPYRGRGAHARTATIAWLLDQLSGILAQADSVRFGLDVWAWQRRLQAATASAPSTRRRGRCPRCHMRSLFLRTDGYTECRGCGQLLNDAEYEALDDTAVTT